MIELKIALVIFLLILSVFFSGSEAALMSLSKLKLKRLKNPILTELLKHPNKLLTGLLSGTTIVNVLACVIATTIFLDIEDCLACSSLFTDLFSVDKMFHSSG